MRILTSGESHGRGLLGILEGMPAGLEITAAYIDTQLKRRQQGYGRGGRMKIEDDRIEIISGIRFGKTIGSPVGVLLWNKDWENWKDQMTVEPGEVTKKTTVPRPGHADLAGIQKYGFDDTRPVIERSSARETAMRVALGTIARRLLEEFGITIASHVVQIGDVWADEALANSIRSRSLDEISRLSDSSEVRTLDEETGEKMMEAIRTAQQSGDSLGGVFEVHVDGLPAGLGSYTHWDKKLDGILAQHICSIHAIKGFEIGDAFHNAGMRGSEVHDAIYHDIDRGYYRKTNRSGGLEGGVTTGERLILRAAMKPIPTLARPLPSVDIHTHEEVSAHRERTDSCSVPAASIVGEAMTALALVNPFLEKFGGDSVDEIRRHWATRNS
ncbi:MAG: chorismate synthase [Bacteroidetes bacterium]|nr:chorismate synthase [Bacteroidota bacterium]